jgi:hypothetical protein
MRLTVIVASGGGVAPKSWQCMILHSPDKILPPFPTLVLASLQLTGCSAKLLLAKI